MSWLWEEWLARGTCTALASEVGVGQTHVALEVVRRTLGGLAMPEETCSQGGGCALFLDAMEQRAVLRQRIGAWEHAPGLDRLYVPTMNGWWEERVDLDRPAQRERLQGMLREVMPALLVVDSLDTAYGSRFFLRSSSTRERLGWWAEVAGWTGAAVLLLLHTAATTSQLRKSDVFQACGGMLRLRYGKGQKPNGWRWLECLKAAGERCPGPLRVGFESVNGGVRLWFAWPARQGVLVKEEPTRVAACAAWLEGFLARQWSREVAPSRVMRAAEARGFNRSLVYRAREHLGGKIRDTEKRAQSPENRWRWLGERIR